MEGMAGTKAIFLPCYWNYYLKPNCTKTNP